MSFQKSKKNFENHKERSKQDMSKRPQFDFQPPTEEIENLTLGRTESRLPTSRTANASFPAWGQIKKLCKKGQNVVTRLGQGWLLKLGSCYVDIKTYSGNNIGTLYLLGIHT
jgi:hypothetical protein